MIYDVILKSLGQAKIVESFEADCFGFEPNPETGGLLINFFRVEQGSDDRKKVGCFNGLWTAVKGQDDE